VSGGSRDPERPAPSPALIPGGDLLLALGESSKVLHATPVESAERRPVPSRRRVWAARVLALAADAVQFALLPLVIGGAASPINDAIDIVTAVALSALVGFHWAFLPTFIAKLVPFADMVPSWSLAVFITTRGSAVRIKSGGRGRGGQGDP
jgi:hypothetical protein